MRNLYKITLFFFLSFLMVLSSKNALASHAMGADITYTCIGNNQYLVTMSFYRDCFGIPAPPQMSLNFSNDCGLPNPATVQLQPTPGSPTQISPLCPSATSTCNGGTFTGIEEWIYTGVVTLTGPCANWQIAHSENARNAAITTITGGGSDDLYVYSTINNTNNICNNSPVFSNRPVPFACLGQRFCFNHGAFDPDGDSLSYQIITPRNGPLASDTVTYLPGYSATQPVLSVPPMSFNPLTGDFCMTPTQLDVTVLAIVVNEWRNGVLIGQVERDIQVTVLNCNNFLPSITGMNGTPQFNASVCAGNELCFYIASIDPDAPNQTFITWDGSIPGATLTTTGGQRDSAMFCWTPTAAQISTTPYCFTVTVSDNSCPYIGIQVYSFCITVNGVDPDAGPDQTIPCGVQATLTGSATLGNGVYNYVWSPLIDTTQKDTSQVINVGVGTYILTVTSGNCRNYDTVAVLPGNGVPAADFNFTNNCSGLPIQFNDLSNVVGSTIGSWSWDFGDGTPGSNSQNPTHSYAANGTYDVTLTVSTPSNCTSSMTQQVVVNTNIPTAQFAANNVCDGSPMNFLDQTLGTGLSTWSWNFDDPASGSNTSASQNPSHTFSSPGTYSVSLTVTNTDGCQNQVNQNVTVNANPNVFVADAGMCQGGQATLNGPAGFAIYQWSSGGTAQSITVSPAVTTNYTLTATDANGCSGSHTAAVAVDPLPVPDAGPDQTICEGTVANLTGLGGTSYVWNPGNLNGQNVAVTPNVTTLYTLTVSTNAGCSATDVIQINVNPMPSADAGDDVQLCEGEAATINSVASAGIILWTPGNFNTPSITVAPAVTTTYHLMVSDAIGCSGEDSITIYVNPLPDARILNANPVCLNNPSQFTDMSVVASGGITSWLWNFGDGQTSNSQNPSHTYNNAGNFNISLSVTTNAGCKDSSFDLTIVNPLPVADAGADAGICPGFNATLNGNGGMSYLWNPGGLTSQSITLSPAATTDYTLIVTDGNGCTGTDMATIDVYPQPVANAGQDQSICLGEWTTLYGVGGDYYQWSPGGANTQTYNIGPAATTTYTLEVTNTFGCISTDQVTVQINPIPAAALSSSGPICEDSPVSFNDLSSVSSGNLIAWNWNFGNGVSSSNQNPTIPYYNPGVFQVSLVVWSDNGCSDTTDFMQTIWPKPAAAFVNTNVCDGIPVDFTNASTIVDATPLTYDWDLGDSFTSTSASLSHQYASYGSYNAKLVVTSTNGCTDVVNKLVSVHPLPTASFASEYACEDAPAVFVNSSTIPTGIISSYYWTFGDNISSTEMNPTHVYDDYGDYDIRLRVASDHGCPDSTDGAIRVAPKPLVDFLTENSCLGYVINLTDGSQGVTGPVIAYQWTFGDGNTSNDQNPVHLYAAPGWYEVGLTAISDSGCKNTLIRPNALEIYAPPVPQFISNATDANDIYPLVKFFNQTPSAEYYFWNFGDGDTSMAFSPQHLYADVGTYDVQLIAVDYRGCVDSTIVRIEIKPTSNVYIPNAFTPNGDLRNDYFQVYSYNVVTMTVQIYDRWGLKIAEWDTPKGSWDGKVNGNPAQADTYVYRVSTIDVNNKKEVFIGHVSLVR